MNMRYTQLLHLMAYNSTIYIHSHSQNFFVLGASRGFGWSQMWSPNSDLSDDEKYMNVHTNLFQLKFWSTISGNSRKKWSMLQVFFSSWIVSVIKNPRCVIAEQIMSLNITTVFIVEINEHTEMNKNSCFAHHVCLSFSFLCLLINHCGKEIITILANH